MVFARLVEAPGPGFPVQVVAAVMGDHDLLAEPVVAVVRAALALAAPNAYQRQQRQQGVIQVGAFPEVRGVRGHRKVVVRGDIPGSGQFGPLGRLRQLVRGVWGV